MREEDLAVDKTAAWELFVARLKPLLEDMPCLQPFHDGLQGLIEEARALEERELALRRLPVEREGARHSRPAGRRLHGPHPPSPGPDPTPP